jgi:cyclin-dependent kinase 7
MTSEDYYKQKYQKRRKVGEGTYAVVYEGVVAESNRPIAIKKIKLGAYSSGIEVSALREIKYLQELQHPNIIEAKNVADCS